MSKKTSAVSRYLVMYKNQLAAARDGAEAGWGYLNSYSMKVPNAGIFARECAKWSGAVLVAEYDEGTLEIVEDYSR